MNTPRQSPCSTSINFVKQYHLYADDIHIKTSSKLCMWEAVAGSIISDLEKSLKFSKNYFLKMNPTKSAALLFCCDTYRHQLESIIKQLGKYPIPFCNSEEDLCHKIDCNLKLREHHFVSEQS